MNEVDVVVLDIDGGPLLEACIASIRDQTTRPARIIVIDNGSITPVAARLTGVETHRFETNRGFAAGVNAALRLSSAPYLALVNNDVVLDPDWLSHVRGALERDERLAAVQTIIRRPDGRIDGAGIDISDGTIRQIGYGQNVGSPLAVAWGVSATAALYRRAAVGERMFDERFFAYYEDVELCASLRAEGWRTSVLPLIKATHHGSASAQKLGKDALRLRTRNRYFVARMHPGVGRIGALLREDLMLLLKRRSSLRGIMQGVLGAIDGNREKGA
jgi:GT2 family glycosyltransferase